MIKFKLKVINIEYEKGKTELISAQIKIKYGENLTRVFIVLLLITYLAPDFSTGGPENISATNAEIITKIYNQQH